MSPCTPDPGRLRCFPGCATHMSACLSFDFPGWRADVQPLQDGSPGPDTGTTRALTDLLDELDDLEPDCEDGTRQKLTQQHQQAQQQPSSEATSTADVDEQKLAQGPTYRTAGGACLQDVPDEVLNIIMAHLDTRSLTSLALTSSQLITRVMASSSTADAWRRSATQHALAPITAAVQSLLSQGPCPELCSCSQGSQARSILSLKHSRQEVREQHMYLNAKYMQLLKALLALWRQPLELDQQDGAAGWVGGGGSNSMRNTDPCSRNSGSGCSGYEQCEPSSPGGPQAATAAAGTAAGEEEGAAPTTAAVEAAAPALPQHGPGQLLYTASKGIVAGGPLQLQPIKRSECMDPGVLIAQLLKYDWNVAFDCVLLAFDLAADVIAAELAHQEQQRQQQRQGPCQLLPLLLHQFSGFRAFVRAVNARCPRLKDMISAGEGQLSQGDKALRLSCAPLLQHLGLHHCMLGNHSQPRGVAHVQFTLTCCRCCCTATRSATPLVLQSGRPR